MKKIIIFLMLFFPMLAYSESTVGLGYYSIENKTFPCDRALKAFNGVKKPALMFLWGTFGDNLSCVEKYAKLPQKQKAIYIHFSNECCRRNNTCKQGELAPKLSVKELNIRLEAKKNGILNKYETRMNEILMFIDNVQKYSPDMEWYISTGLEDNFTPRAARVVFNHLREFKKKSSNSNRITIYVNPLKSSLCINERCEIHDKNYGKNNHWLYIPDGYCVKPFDACNINVFTETELNNKLKAQIRNGNKFFVWWSEQQGRYGEPPNRAKPPRQRTIKITDKQISMANSLLKKGN